MKQIRDAIGVKDWYKRIMRQEIRQKMKNFCLILLNGVSFWQEGCLI